MIVWDLKGIWRLMMVGLLVMVPVMNDDGVRALVHFVVILVDEIRWVMMAVMVIVFLLGI